MYVSIYVSCGRTDDGDLEELNWQHRTQKEGPHQPAYIYIFIYSCVKIKILYYIIRRLEKLYTTNRDS